MDPAHKMEDNAHNPVISGTIKSHAHSQVSGQVCTHTRARAYTADISAKLHLCK